MQLVRSPAWMDHSPRPPPAVVSERRLKSDGGSIPTHVGLMRHLMHPPGVPILPSSHSPERGGESGRTSNLFVKGRC